MKKLLLTFMLLIPFLCFSQGRSISMKKKITEPYITTSQDTLKVGTMIMTLDAKGDNNEYKYISLLNGLNEPIKRADTRAAFKKQPILFFKEEDGTMYLFTKFFCINIEGALMTEELKIIK